MPFKNSPNSGIMALEEKTQLKLRTRLLLNLGSVLLAIKLVLAYWGDKLDHAISDALFKVHGPLTKPPDIVLVGIDNDSFENLKLQWPWPSGLLAKLLINPESLSEA